MSSGAGGDVLDLTVTIDNGAERRHVRAVGRLDVSNATEFGQVLRQINEAVGAAWVDLTGIELGDEAAHAAVRTLIRHAEEFGGTVCAPATLHLTPAC